MGRNGRTKANGKVVSQDLSDRPGWRGPGYAKKKVALAPKPQPYKEEDEEEADESAISLELQQFVLNLFKDTFPEVLESNDRQQLLQDVKTALYERDFARAFGREDYLVAYSIRWSPSRALCYQSMLVDISEHLVGLFPACAALQDEEEDELDSSVTSSTLNAVCFGGGAAEVVAFGGFLRFLLDNFSSDHVVTKSSSLEDEIATLSVLGKAEEDSKDIAQDTLDNDHNIISTTTACQTTAQSMINHSKLNLTLIDSAQWGEVSTKLATSIHSPPPISKYANAAAKAANLSLLSPGSLTTTFHQSDILSLPFPELQGIIGGKPFLVTLLFTLNELYTTSISSTTKFLLNLTMAAKPGTVLLVVDSPGSYSETTVNGSEKRYPMKWLLDHTLLHTAKVEEVEAWEKVVGDESRWFRVRGELRYPIQLENMRYQIHLYRRL